MALELTYEPVELPISGARGTTTGGSIVAVAYQARDRGIDNPIRLSISGRHASMAAREARVLATALNALADKVEAAEAAEEVPF